MATNIVQMTDGTGNKQYPVTSAEAVGMPDGSGNLTNYLDKRVTEYNVSVLHPTSGSGGSNKYTLETAIEQVPSKYRSVGIKCAFINESGEGECWEYKVGSWNVNGFVQVGSAKLTELEKESESNTNTFKFEVFPKINISKALSEEGTFDVYLDIKIGEKYTITNKSIDTPIGVRLLKDNGELTFIANLYYNNSVAALPEESYVGFSFAVSGTNFNVDIQKDNVVTLYDEVKSNEIKIESVKSDVDAIISIDYYSQKTSGGYYKLGEVGSSVNTSIITENSYSYGVFDCKQGDTIDMYGQFIASDGVRWAITNDDGEILLNSKGLGLYSERIIVPENGTKFYWNLRTSAYPGKVIKTGELDVIKEDIQDIEEYTNTLKSVDYYSDRVKGGYYTLGEIGSIVNESIVTDADYSHGYINCIGRDSIEIYGQFLLSDGVKWAITNSDGTILQNSKTVGLYTERINIPENGVKLYWNLRTKAYVGSVKKIGIIQELQEKVEESSDTIVACGDSTTASYLPEFFKVASSLNLTTRVAYCGGENSLGNLSRVGLPFHNKSVISIPESGDTEPFEICSSWINTKNEYSPLNFVSLSGDKTIGDVILGGVKGTLSKQDIDIYGLVIYDSGNTVIQKYKNEVDNIVAPVNASYIKVCINKNDVNEPHLTVNGEAKTLKELCINSGYIDSNGQVVESEQYLHSDNIPVNSQEKIYADNLASGNLYIFKRSVNGSVVTFGKLCDIYTTRAIEWINSVYIIFTGQNNGYERTAKELVGQINATINGLGIKKYIVVNPWAHDVSTMELKKEMTANFGNRFFDLDTFMKEQSVYEAIRLGIITEGNQSDYKTIFSDDGTHPNTNGAKLWSYIFMNKLIDLGFIKANRFSSVL